MNYPKINNTAELELLPDDTIVGMFVDDPNPLLPKYYAVQKMDGLWLGVGMPDAMRSHEFEVGFPAIVLYREDSDAS